jgi:hypothetical protein
MARPERQMKIRLNPHAHRLDGTTYTVTTRLSRKLKARAKTKAKKEAAK